MKFLAKISPLCSYIWTTWNVVFRTKAQFRMEIFYCSSFQFHMSESEALASFEASEHTWLCLYSPRCSSPCYSFQPFRKHESRVKQKPSGEQFTQVFSELPFSCNVDYFRIQIMPSGLHASYVRPLAEHKMCALLFILMIKVFAKNSSEYMLIYMLFKYYSIVFHKRQSIQQIL